MLLPHSSLPSGLRRAVQPWMPAPQPLDKYWVLWRPNPNLSLLPPPVEPIQESPNLFDPPRYRKQWGARDPWDPYIQEANDNDNWWWEQGNSGSSREIGQLNEAGEERTRKNEAILRRLMQQMNRRDYAVNKTNLLVDLINTEKLYINQLESIIRVSHYLYSNFIVANLFVSNASSQFRLSLLHGREPTSLLWIWTSCSAI